MGYVIAGILVVLIVGGFAMFLVMNATKRSNVADADDPGRDGPTDMLGSEDDSPLGDTEQHAGEQDESGHTVGGQDADEHGGTGQPRTEGYGGEAAVGERERDTPHAARPVVGGEAEGERRIP